MPARRREAGWGQPGSNVTRDNTGFGHGVDATGAAPTLDATADIPTARVRAFTMAPWLLPPLLRACRASSSRLHMRGVERELFALIRAAPQEPAGFREACGRVADWGRLVDCAIDHGVAGVVHTEAGKAGWRFPPTRWASWSGGWPSSAFITCGGGRCVSCAGRGAYGARAGGKVSSRHRSQGNALSAPPAPRGRHSSRGRHGKRSRRR